MKDNNLKHGMVFKTKENGQDKTETYYFSVYLDNIDGGSPGDEYKSPFMTIDELNAILESHKDG